MHKKMTKLHSTLRPSTNIILTILWGAVCLILFFSSSPRPVILLLSGIIIGAVCGVLQLLSFNEARESFLDASTMIEVRNKLKATTWGRRYIYFLWGGNVLLVIIALKLTPNLHSILVGYFALMFTRELITLKPSFELDKLKNK